MASSTSCRPYNTPMPVGPQILWPENAKKSQPMACTSTGQMPGALRAVHERGDAELARAGAKVGHGIDRAERVGDVNHREQLHLLRQQRIELGQVEHAFVAGDGQVGELRAGALGEQLPRHEVAVVLHLREQDHVAGFEIFRAPGLATRLMPSVVPRVKMISSALRALMNLAARVRAAS